MHGFEQRRIGLFANGLRCEVGGIRPKDSIPISSAFRAMTAGAMLDVELFSLCHPIRPCLRARISIAGHRQREDRRCDANHSPMGDRDMNELPGLFRQYTLHGLQLFCGMLSRLKFAIYQYRGRECTKGDEECQEHVDARVSHHSVADNTGIEVGFWRCPH